MKKKSYSKQGHLGRCKSGLFSLRGLFLLCLPLFYACEAAPPSPPEDLEELLGFLFEHAADEEQEALAQGIVDLHTWFQDPTNLDRAREGFVISKLSEAAWATTVSSEVAATGAVPKLEGVHVVTKSPYCVRSIVGLLTWENFGDLLDAFDSYERTFDRETECMIDRSCESVIAQSETRSQWAGLIGITTRYHIEFRWVFTEVGWALVHRFWLKEPAIGDKWGVKMNANYYVGITLPDQSRSIAPPSPAFVSLANGSFAQGGQGIEQLRDTLQQPGSLRIHANWFNVDTGDIPFTDSQIANLLVQQQKNDSEAHDEMITENESPGKCMQDDEENLSPSTGEE